VEQMNTLDGEQVSAASLLLVARAVAMDLREHQFQCPSRSTATSTVVDVLTAAILRLPFRFEVLQSRWLAFPATQRPRRKYWSP